MKKAVSLNEAPLNNEYIYIPNISGVPFIFSNINSLALSVARDNNTDIDKKTSCLAPTNSNKVRKLYCSSIVTSNTDTGVSTTSPCSLTYSPESFTR